MLSNQYRDSMSRDGSLVLHGEAEPFMNWVFKFSSRRTVSELAGYVLVWMIFTSAIATLFLNYAGCVSSDLKFVNCLLLVCSMILGGNGPSMSEDGVCPVISFAITIFAFASDVIVISLFINKLTSPQAKVVLSDKCVVKRRNGQLLLQTRFMSMYGHGISDIEVIGCLYYHTVSAEGERFAMMKTLEFTSFPFAGFDCRNVTHLIDENSPLTDETWEDFKGSIEIIVTGFDRMLQQDVYQGRMYNHGDIFFEHEFVNGFVVSPTEVSRDPSKRLTVDIRKLSAVQPVVRESTSEDMAKKEGLEVKRGLMTSLSLDISRSRSIDSVPSVVTPTSQRTPSDDQNVLNQSKTPRRRKRPVTLTKSSTSVSIQEKKHEDTSPFSFFTYIVHVVQSVTLYLWSLASNAIGKSPAKTSRTSFITTNDPSQQMGATAQWLHHKHHHRHKNNLN